MSAKWKRARAWDDANLVGTLAPVKWVLRAFSSITLAVTLLTSVAIYGTLASVPIGLFALIPTLVFYGATLLAVLAAGAGVPMYLARRPIARLGTPGARFLARLALGVVLTAASVWVWRAGLWPVIRYWPPDAAHQLPASGVRFFSEFIAGNTATLLRQLPAWDMSELEFYGWWPFRLILVVFVLNMVVATIRRIEFDLLHVGVLTVHTGIVTIALGSLAYQTTKVEGDMVLFRGGLPRAWFYDALRPAIYAWPEGNENQFMMALARLPRYNNAPAGSPYAPNIALNRQDAFLHLFSPDLEIAVVGIIPYGRQVSTGWQDGGEALNPSVRVSLVEMGSGGAGKEIGSQRLVGFIPAAGTVHTQDLTIQHLPAPSHQRVEDLSAEFPAPGEHLLIGRVPAAGFEQAFTVKEGDEIALGETGWRVKVTDYQASHEGLSIITPGYEGAASSRLIVSATGPGGKAFQRHVLDRYPELTQDFSGVDATTGRPRRTPPDPALDLTYIDATQAHFRIVQADPLAARFTVIRRERGGAVHVDEIESGGIVAGGEFDGAPVGLKVDELWTRTTMGRSIEAVPRDEQEREARGTWARAFLNVEIRARKADGQMWVRREWLPFNQYLDSDPMAPGFDPSVMMIDVPSAGGPNRINLAFGRLRRRLPGIAIQLADFEMTPYPGTNTPRDYASTLVVKRPAEFTQDDLIGHPGGATRDGNENRQADSVNVHVTQLNHPYRYRVPFEGREDRPWLANSAARLANFIVPDQYKFSQAGWDPQNQSFSVLGVGNNTGIHVIATGAFLMGIGIPIAFYVKPAILRRRARIMKERLEEEKAAARARSEMEETSGVAAAAERGQDVTDGKPTSRGAAKSDLAGARRQ